MSSWEAWEETRPPGYAFENVRRVTALEREARQGKESISRAERKRRAALMPKRRRRRTVNDERWNMRIPGHLADKLRRLAAAAGVTGSQWIREAIAAAREPEEESDHKA